MDNYDIKMLELEHTVRRWDALIKSNEIDITRKELNQFKKQINKLCVSHAKYIIEFNKAFELKKKLLEIK